jgi:hypothetical protein
MKSPTRLGKTIGALFAKFQRLTSAHPLAARLLEKMKSLLG